MKECRPQQRLLIQTKSPDEPDGVIEATLTADGDQAVLVIEDRGLPPEKIAAYAAGDQVHVEDLASYLAGRERCDARVRWQELHPVYQELAAKLTWDHCWSAPATAVQGATGRTSALPTRHEF